jgi:hypothetical protein
MMKLGTALDSDIFFGITLILISLSAFAGSNVSGVYSLASAYSPIFTQAIQSGQGLTFLSPLFFPSCNY